MKKILILVFMLVLVFFLWSNREENRPDYPINSPTLEEPIQQLYNGKQTLKKTHKEYNLEIKPQATYRIYARVMSKKRYDYDEMSFLVPYDLVLAWGKLMLKENQQGIKYSQDNRWYYYRYEASFALDPSYIVTHSANNHIIPANDNILQGVKELKKLDRVYLEGYLVNVDMVSPKKTFSIGTSLSREDSEGGACEVFYVTKLISHKGVYK